MNILHISDIHFGSDFFYKTTNSEVKSELSLAGSIQHALSDLIIDHIVISGDIFDRNNFEEIYELALSELKLLFMTFGLDPHQISIIPGNHDILWYAKNGNKYRYYDKLCIDLGLSELTSNHFPIVRDISDNIKIVLLDSNIYEGEDFAGLGQTGSAQLSKIESDKELIEFGTQENNFIFAACHHHLLPINNDSLLTNPDTLKISKESGIEEVSHKLSLTLDSINVLKKLGKVGVSLIMSGHQHQQALYEFKDLGNETNSIIYSAIGSVSYKHVYYRSFNVYTTNGNELSMSNYKNEDVTQTYFQLHKKFVLPVTKKSSFINLDVCNSRTNFDRITSTFLSDEFSEDYSDLFVMLLSVVDCRRSRGIITNWINNWNESHPKDHQIVVQGMYDLLGKFDLYVVFRCAKSLSMSKEVFNPIRKELIDKSQMDKIGVFSKFIFHDVMREAGNFTDISNEGTVSYSRIKVGDNSAYELHRVQKGLVYIDCLNVSKQLVVNQLKALSLDVDYESFINCVYISEKAIFIEFVAKCSEYMNINKFNRRIAPVLADLRIQKYNLLFYNYDE